MCAKIHPDLLGKLSAYQGSLFGSWAGNRCYVGWKIVPWTLLDDISPVHAKMAGTDLFFSLERLCMPDIDRFASDAAYGRLRCNLCGST